jgi:DNA-binding transcriptional LysR family regulator
MKVNSDELQIYVAVVDAGKISRAALQLGQNPSSISRTLARLEEKLGVTLLTRTTRRQELTEEGLFFLERARRILREMEEAEDHLFECSRQPVGRLRIDTATPFMLHCILPYIPEFNQRYPDIELELTSNEGIVDLLEQRTDVALRIGQLSDSSLHARLIGTTQRRVLASPAYLATFGEPRKPEDLDKHRILGFIQPGNLNQWHLQSNRGKLWNTKPALRSSSGETLRQLALLGEGIVCISDFQTHADRKAGRLVEILADYTLPEPQPIHAVYYRQTNLASRIRVFIDFLMEKLQGTEGPL